MKIYYPKLVEIKTDRWNCSSRKIDKVALDRETVYYFQKARWMDTIRQELEKEEKSLSFLHLSAIRSQKAKRIYLISNRPKTTCCKRNIFENFFSTIHYVKLALSKSCNVILEFRRQNCANQLNIFENF